MLTIFYITVFTLKSRLRLFKILYILCLATLYFSSFVYYTHSLLDWLPIVQKISLLLNIVLVVGLEYGAKGEDFGHVLTKTGE